MSETHTDSMPRLVSLNQFKVRYSESLLLDARAAIAAGEIRSVRRDTVTHVELYDEIALLEGTARPILRKAHAVLAQLRAKGLLSKRTGLDYQVSREWSPPIRAGREIERKTSQRDVERRG